jgi:hypothetical protein
LDQRFCIPQSAERYIWSTTALIEDLEYAGRHCCTRYAYGSNPAGLRELTNRLINGMEIRAERSGWELSGEGERILELETMMIHSETLWRKGSTAVVMPGIGSTAMDFQETQNWAYNHEV